MSINDLEIRKIQTTPPRLKLLPGEIDALTGEPGLWLCIGEVSNSKREWEVLVPRRARNQRHVRPTY